MATRIEQILTNARRTLADKQAQRWTDSDLLALLDEGHKDLCHHSQILHGRQEVLLTIGDPYFQLPDDCWMLTRVTYEDEVLPLVTHHELDHRGGYTHGRYRRDGEGSSWETDTGSPDAIIYDRRNLLECRVYPIPDESIVDEVYTFEQQVPPVEFIGDAVFGVVTGLDDYTLDSVYGVAVDMYEPGISQEDFDSVYGVVSDITDNSGKLKCYYIRTPQTIVSVDDELQTPAMFDVALKFYVIGHAFMNDIDTEYQQKGGQQLQFYQRELQVAQDTQTRDGTRASQFRTEYRRGV